MMEVFKVRDMPHTCRWDTRGVTVGDIRSQMLSVRTHFSRWRTVLTTCDPLAVLQVPYLLSLEISLHSSSSIFPGTI